MKNTTVVSNNIKYGIDVSHHNGKINWPEVAKGNNPKIEFVFTKATEGDSFVSPTFAENWGAISETKLTNNKGAYHFYKTNKGAEEQAKHFSQTLESNKFDKEKDSWALDVERNDGKLLQEEFAKDLTLFTSYMENKGFNAIPFIYTRTSFWNKELGPSGKDLMSKCHLWISRYYKDTGQVPPEKDDPGELPSGAPDWSVWQFTSKGHVEGITSVVDLNVASHDFDLKLGGETYDGA